MFAVHPVKGTTERAAAKVWPCALGLNGLTAQTKSLTLIFNTQSTSIYLWKPPTKLRLGYISECSLVKKHFGILLPRVLITEMIWFKRIYLSVSVFGHLIAF